MEEAGGGSGRQRPWQVAQGGLRIGQQSDPAADRAATALGDMYVERALTRMRTALARRRALPAPWRRATSYSESVVWVTAAEAIRMSDEITAIHTRHADRSRDPELRPAGARPVEVLHFIYPYDEV